MSYSAQDRELLNELFGFLQDKNPVVRRVAMENLLPYTAQGRAERSLFMENNRIEHIAALLNDVQITVHDALSALINLTSQIGAVNSLANIPGMLAFIVSRVINPKLLLSDLFAMLLSNMSKSEKVCEILLGIKVQVPPGLKESHFNGANIAKSLDLLLKVFLLGDNKKYNENANYDFLASVFANVATTPKGRSYLLASHSSEEEPPLAALISFTEHPSVIRRGGVASAIKNSAFHKSCHHRLLAPANNITPGTGRIDILPQILLPLCGNEEFDIDIMDTLPDEIQLLPQDKKREPDDAIRLILVETLILLATTRSCREALKKRGVYHVIKQAHLVETNLKITEPMVQLVGLLIRDEDEAQTAIEELDEEENFRSPAYDNEHGETNDDNESDEATSNFVSHETASFTPGEIAAKKQKTEHESSEGESSSAVVPAVAPVSAPAPQEESDDEDMIIEVL